MRKWVIPITCLLAIGLMLVALVALRRAWVSNLAQRQREELATILGVSEVPDVEVVRYERMLPRGMDGGSWLEAVVTVPDSAWDRMKVEGRMFKQVAYDGFASPASRTPQLPAPVLPPNAILCGYQYPHFTHIDLKSGYDFYWVCLTRMGAARGQPPTYRGTCIVEGERLNGRTTLYVDSTPVTE